jgi:hypothetical protein
VLKVGDTKTTSPQQSEKIIRQGRDKKLWKREIYFGEINSGTHAGRPGSTVCFYGKYKSAKKIE